jgi:hypothetical protein
MVARSAPKGLVIMLLLVGASLVAGCAGPGKPSSLPVEDDFSSCSTGWSTDTDEFVSLSCTDGAYRMLIKNPLKPQNARIFFSTGVESLNVEADASRRAGPKTVEEKGFLAFGVGCWSSLVQGYIFLISPDGVWGIEKITSGVSVPTSVAESATPNAIPGLRATNRVRGVCVGGGRRPTTLALYVNGKRIAAAEDRDGFDSFPGFGFFVFSSKSGADVRFDNLVARKVTDAEERLARAATKPAHMSAGATAKPSPSKLCKLDGIRYAGTTAQGAEVCLTLSPDGSELIETGFSFVAASGCPDEAAGTVHSDYPGTVEPSGRVVNPDGLTATIRGATASGVFADSQICPGKTFKWSARRLP